MGTAQNVLAALAGYGLKQEGEGRYRLNSPFRPGSNSHAFSLKIEDEEHGTWKDHVSEQSGSLYELAKHLGIEVQRITVASTKRAYSGLKDYAEAHGLLLEEITCEPWSWREKRHKNRAALEFHTNSGRRWRFIDGEEPRYISEFNYKPCWYGLRKDVASAVDETLPLVICNGEVSTIAGQNAGIMAVCMTSGEKSAIPSDLMAELKRVIKPHVPILVALDCDSKGRVAGLGMAAQLKSEGYNARAIDLGLSDGGDLADFCKLYGAKSTERIVQCADLALPSPKTESVVTPRRDYGIPESKRLGAGANWLIIGSDDLCYVPPVRWLLKPYVVADDDNVIYGPPGSGKSFFAIWLALQMAQSAPVLYVAYEGVNGFDARIRACRKHYGYRNQLLMALGGPRLMHDADFDAFVNAVKPLKPVCVFFDTLARSLSGDLDESNNRDMGMYLERIDEFRARVGCASVIIHHTGKNGVIRGASSIHGNVSNLIEITPNDEFIEVSISKAKDSDDSDVKLFKLHPVDTGLKNEDGFSVFSPVLVQSDGKADPRADMTKNQRKVLEVMGLEINKYGARYTDISQVLTNMAGRSLYNALSSLLKRGYIEQESKNEPYMITSSGRAALDAGKPWQAPIEEETQVSMIDSKNGELPGMPSTGSAYHKAGL